MPRNIAWQAHFIMINYYEDIQRQAKKANQIIGLSIFVCEVHGYIWCYTNNQSKIRLQSLQLLWQCKLFYN